MAIRILASDLDGTLLNEKGKIAAETAKAIKTAQRAGMRFVAATGRAWGTAHPILQEAGIDMDCVLLNGAEFRTSSGEVIYQETIDCFTAQRIMEYLSAEQVDFEVNTDIGDFSTNTNKCNSASEFQNCTQFWIGNPKILKFFVFSDVPALVRKTRRYLRNYDEITVTSSAEWNVEITSATACKGRMLKKAAEFYQVSKEEVIVFGDGENDETMFREFCRSRAVGNAVPTILQLAEKTIASNRENGVAKEINIILGGLQYGHF